MGDQVQKAGGGRDLQETPLSSVCVWGGTLLPLSCSRTHGGRNPSVLWVTKEESHVLVLFATIAKEHWLCSGCPGTKGGVWAKPAAEPGLSQLLSLG